MMLRNILVYWFLVELLAVSLASDNSKVLMLDTRNLQGVDKDWGNGKDYSVTLAKDSTRAKLPSQFTICNSNFALGLINQGGTASFWAWRIKNEDLNGVWMEALSYFGFSNVATKDLEMGLGVVVNGAWLFQGSYGSLYFNRWHHICIAVNLDTEVLSFVAEGFIYDDLEVPGMRKGAPTSLDGRLIPDDSRLTVSNYMVGNIQVFGRILSKEEMVSITAGKDCGREGDFLAWKDMEWEVKGKVNGWVNVTKKELCASKTAPFRFVNTQASSFYDHKSICTKMDRGRIPAAVDKPTMEELLDYYRNTAMQLKTDDKGVKRWTTHPGNDRCYFFWLPLELRNKTWLDHYTSKPIDYFHWGDNVGVPEDNPPGSCVWGEASNASDIAGKTNQGGGGKWLVHVPPCNGIGGMCSTCEKETQPMVRLRGLCRDSDLTNLFTPVNDEKSALGYVGLSQTTSITYNASTFMWVTSNMGWSDVVATNPSSLASGLLGTSEWIVHNDSRKCSPNASYKILLTLTACQQHQFTCVDANCIPMESRFSVQGSIAVSVRLW